MSRTRRLKTPWPFLWGVEPGRRGLVRYLPPIKPKPRRLRKIPPASKWTQETLL